MKKALAPVHLRIGGAALVSLVSLTVYLLTLAPTVTFVDSGELIVAARFLGVAHPPGFPLYVMLAHLATLIPIGNIARRVNFASALLAALAVGFLYLVAIEALAFSVNGKRDSCYYREFWDPSRATCCHSECEQPTARARSCECVVLLLPAITFAGKFPCCNRHNFRLAGDYVANIQSSIAPRGMLLTTDWQVYSPLLYLRETEQQRRDVVAIDLQMLRRSWYYGYLKTQYPDLITENQQAVEAFLVELRQWENAPEAFARSRAFSKGINDRFHEMILAFVSNHLRHAPVYITDEVGTATMAEDALLTQLFVQRYELVPHGLVFQLTTNHNFQADAGADLVTRGLADGTFRFAVDDVVVLQILPAYVTMLVNRGRYLETYERYDEAMQFYKRALALEPNSTLAQQAMNNLRHAKQKLSLPAGS